MSTSADERLPAAPGDAGPGRAGEGEYHAVLPAAPAAVPAARAYVRAVAGACLRVGEVEVIASELASCAVRQMPGGVFTMTARHGPGWLRVEVAMVGSGWWPAGDGEDAVTYGYGLAIVAGLADRFGHQGTPDGTAMLWAEASTSDGCAVGDHDEDTRVLL